MKNPIRGFLDRRRAVDRSTVAIEIRVASPCPARWEDMVGDDRARFCAQCQKSVYNLSALTAPAAEALLREKAGDLCGRFYSRADGTILHADDCSVGLATRQWRRLRYFAGAVASFLLFFPGGNESQAEDLPNPAPTGRPLPTPSPTRPPGQPPIMGKICPPRPPERSPSPAPNPKPE